MTVASVGNVTLRTKNGCLLNCLGIQPVFVEDGVIKESFLGYVYRTTSRFNSGGTMRYMNKYRENDTDILKNSFHISQASQKVVSLLRNNSFAYKHKGSLDELMKNKDLLKETIMFYLERIKYLTSYKGNFLITSRVDLYNTRLFTSVEVQNFDCYLVDEKLLPRNVIIVGHRNLNSYCTPYVACPIIDQKNFDKLCEMNGINVRDFVIDGKKELPIVEKYLDLYSLYQSYLDNVEVPYWYIETFRNPTKSHQKAYYTTLFFD